MKQHQDQSASVESMSAGGSSYQPDSQEIREKVRLGVDLCRRGKLEESYCVLRSVTEEVVPNRDFPGSFFSCLGYGTAALRAQYNDGLALCLRGVEMEFYNPENHLNLARTYMLLGAKRKAMEAIRSGLRVDPEHRGLHLLRRQLGARKHSVLGFLPRGHPLNRWLGAFRHSLGPRAKKPLEPR